jgi:hypothetical protein
MPHLVAVASGERPISDLVEWVEGDVAAVHTALSPTLRSSAE